MIARASAPAHLRPDLDLPRPRGRVHRCLKNSLSQKLVEDHDRAALDELARAADEHGDELDARRAEHVEHRPARADHDSWMGEEKWAGQGGATSTSSDLNALPW